MSGGEQEAEDILGLDKVDDSAESDKSTTQAILDKQVDDTNYASVDDAIDDNDAADLG